MFPVAKTYISRQETVRFPPGKHRKPFCFIHYSQERFTMEEDDDEKADLEVEAGKK